MQKVVDDYNDDTVSIAEAFDIIVDHAEGNDAPLKLTINRGHIKELIRVGSRFDIVCNHLIFLKALREYIKEKLEALGPSTMN